MSTTQTHKRKSRFEHIEKYNRW